MSETDLPQERLDIGKVISRTFGILGRNLGAIGTVAFAVAFASIAIGFGVGYTLPQLFPGVVPLQGLEALGGMVGFVLQSVAVGGITRIAISDLDERRIGPGAALATGFRLLLPLVGLTIVYALGVGFASILLVIPGIWLALRWGVSTPVRVVEGPTVGNALARSGALTKGHRWRLLVLMIAIGVFSIGINFTFRFLGAALSSDAGQALRLITVGAVSVIGSTISTSITSTGLAVCYIELRRIADGSTFRDLAAVFA